MVRNLTQYNHEYFLNHRTEMLAKDRAYYKKHREEVKARQKLHRDGDKQHEQERHSEWYENIAKFSLKEDYRNLREVVIDRLGSKCVSCGITDFRCLQVDHIRNNGYQERKRIPHWRKYYETILNLSEEQLKESYQLLCANCNWIRKYDSGL